MASDLGATLTWKLDSLREISLLACPRLEPELSYFGMTEVILGEDGEKLWPTKFQDGPYAPSAPWYYVLDNSFCLRASRICGLLLIDSLPWLCHITWQRWRDVAVDWVDRRGDHRARPNQGSPSNEGLGLLWCQRLRATDSLLCWWLWRSCYESHRKWLLPTTQGTL